MRSLQRVERCTFKPQLLIHDAGLTAVGPDDVFTDATLDVVRSVRSYKGKLFLLVSSTLMHQPDLILTP